MPKKTVRVVTKAAPPKSEIQELIEEEIPTAEEIEIGEKILQFQSVFGGKNYRLRIERYIKEESDWETLPQLFSLDGFDPVTALKPYGGGKYRVSLIDAKGHYDKAEGYGGRAYFRLATPPIEASAAPEKKSSFEDPVVQIILKNMETDKAQMVELLKTFAAKPADAPKSPSVTELIDSLAKLNTLSPKDQGGFKNIKEVVELMGAIKDLAPSSDSGGGEGWMGDVLQALKLVKEGGLMPRLGQPPQAPALPAPRRDAPTPITPTRKVEDVMPEQNPILDKLKTYVPIFAGWAKRNSDIEDAAMFLLDEIQEEIVPLICANYRLVGLFFNPGAEAVLQNLVDRSQKPEELQKIFEFAPELSLHKEWCVKVIAQAVKELTTPEEPEVILAPNVAE